MPAVGEGPTPGAEDQLRRSLGLVLGFENGPKVFGPFSSSWLLLGNIFAFLLVVVWREIPTNLTAKIYVFAPLPTSTKS